MSGRTLAQVGLPQPLFIDDVSGNALLTRESTYNEEILATFVAEREPTDDQRVAYEGICNRLESGEGGILFLDAPGGTGKTYLINLLLAKVRSRSQVALAVASSGIAATLLEGGRTAHFMFALPLDLQTRDEPMCAIKHDSDKACLMRQVTFIVTFLTKRTKKRLKQLTGHYETLEVPRHSWGELQLCCPVTFAKLCPLFREVHPLTRSLRALISHALVCRPSASARAYRQTYTFQTQQKGMVGLSGMAGRSNW